MDKNNYFNNRPGDRGRSGKNDYFDDPYRRTKRVSVNTRGTGEGGGYKRTPKRSMPVALAIVIDVFAGALILLLFYLINYVWVPEVSGIDLPTPSSAATAVIKTPAKTDSVVTVSPTQTGLQPTTSPSEAPTASAGADSLRTKFADKFTTGAVENTADSYKSANINVSINKVQGNGVTYFVADIFVADIKYFKAAFAKAPGDVLGFREFTDTIAKEQNAIIAINGDHAIDNKGFVIRNGKLYDQTKSTADALIMNYDGSMQTFTADQLDMNKIINQGAYQAWTFGPMLLTDGQSMTKFNSTVTGANPRTAIGYFEPGHYCFVVVDGRQPGYSNGYTMQELSNLFYNLGCKVAFNLDGGQSTEMAFMGTNINQPYNGGRSTSDIVYIADK